jgi:hypothetical protein
VIGPRSTSAFWAGSSSACTRGGDWISRAVVVNERLGLRVAIESDLPRLWQWVDPAPGVYALGIEPANCSVLGRAHDRGEARLPFLRPAVERTTRIAVAAEGMG